MTAIYRRFFRVTSGPLLEAVREISKKRDEAASQIKKFAESIGAVDTKVYQSGSVAGFVFDKTPCTQKWKRTNSGGYYPKQNSKWGRELVKKIRSLPVYPPFSDALITIGLPSSNAPCLIGDGRGYFCTIEGNSEVLFVSVPWMHVGTKEMDDYLADENSWNASMEFLRWKPSDNMVEIKEWEMLKELEEMA